MIIHEKLIGNYEIIFFFAPVDLAAKDGLVWGTEWKFLWNVDWKD